jgi:thiol-disulfide isomerase/thioredoxin
MFQISVDNMKKIVAILAATAATVVVTLLPSGCIAEKRSGDFVKVGDPVPAFTVANSSGEGTKSFSQADFVGKRSMILFFATWCPDCRRELPIVHEAWLRLRGRSDFQLVAVSRDETAEAVSKYWNSAQIDESGAVTKPSFEGMPWWLDPDAGAFNTFADSYIPRVYLVDTHGEIASVAVETFDLTADQIVELIEGLK